MELLQVENLNFTYPQRNKKAINDVSFSIERGSFNLICGESGCGKTTLLELIKSEIAPFGNISGKIMYNGKLINDLTENESAGLIGFVGQNPDDGIVTDKVWHELSYGLENLGVEQSDIRRRVGEMASYFGIGEWFHYETDKLSGGQKQLLNLASVMVMQPEIILLDEPTGQLDPIAASDFINTVKKLNTEFGLTVIIAEHRLEEVFPISDKVIVMENGKIIIDDNPNLAASKMRSSKLSAGLPSSAKIWNELNETGDCPLTVKDGKSLLMSNYGNMAGKTIPVKPKNYGEPLITAKDVWFRYEKSSKDILCGLCLEIHKSEVFSILGGNGCGKTTTLNVISGIDKAYRGKIKISGKRISDYKGNSLYYHNIAVLPQNPQTVFVKNTVKEDLAEILDVFGTEKPNSEKMISDISEKLGIAGLLNSHPFDLSGGEQQKCALAKILLSNPQILMLDEPTKGLDAASKLEFADLILKLKSDGITIVIVTHDIEFAALVSDTCALFFDGQIISFGNPNEFFSGNSFYTTAASRISRNLFKNAVLCDEVVALCKNGDNK